MKANEFLSGEVKITNMINQEFGVLGIKKVLVFPNQNKKSEKSPDFVVMVSTETGKPMERIGGLWKRTKGEKSPSPFGVI